MKKFKGTSSEFSLLIEPVDQTASISVMAASLEVCSVIPWLDTNPDFAECMANMTLFAESKNLLSAIQRLVEVYDSEDGKQWTTASKKAAIAEARAAIDKALGD